MKPDTSPLFLSLRVHGTPVATVAVDVHESYFFHLTETTIVALPEAGRELEGKAYQTLGEAVHRVQQVVPGSWSDDYMTALEAYCTGDVGRMFREARLHDARQVPRTVGTAVRTLEKHGRMMVSHYSPELCVQRLTTLRSEDGSGEWVSVGLLLPIVPPSLSNHEAIVELRRLEAEGRQNAQIASKHRIPRAEGRLKPKDGGGLFAAVPEHVLNLEQKAALLAMVDDERQGAAAAKRRRLDPKAGHCVFVHGQDVPYRIDDVFTADPPPEAVVPGRPSSRKWCHLTPLGEALDAPIEVHYTAMSSLHMRFAEVSARHESTGPVATALDAAVVQHASATNMNVDELRRQLG